MIYLKNKIVSVTSHGRGDRKHVPELGTEGFVINTYRNQWGTYKLVFLDIWGKKHYASFNQISVVDANPNMNEWENILNKNREKTGLPIIATIKATTSRAILLIDTKDSEFWVPLSQLADVSKASKGDTISVIIPIWLAEKNNIITTNSY